MITSLMTMFWLNKSSSNNIFRVNKYFPPCVHYNVLTAAPAPGMRHVEVETVLYGALADRIYKWHILTPPPTILFVTFFNIPKIHNVFS